MYFQELFFKSSVPLVRHSRTSPNQLLRPLPSILSDFYYMVVGLLPGEVVGGVVAILKRESGIGLRISGEPGVGQHLRGVGGEPGVGQHIG